MPLGETLTILATLANAVQVLRTTNRPAEAPATESAPVVDTMALMAFEFARTANEEAIRRHESARGRLNIIATASIAALLVGAFLGAVSEPAPEGGSPLFIASICAFIVVILGVIILRRAFEVGRVTLDDFVDAPGAGQWEAMARFVERARSAEHDNRRRHTAIELGTDALLLIVALQVVLAATWTIS